MSFLNAKCTTYLIIISEFSNQFWDSYLITLIILSFFLILKIYQKHIIKGIIFLSIAKFTS